MVILEFKEYWENSVNIFKKYNQNYTFGTKKYWNLRPITYCYLVTAPTDEIFVK